MRILYVPSTLQPPPADQKSNRFFLLSEKLDGDVVQPVWFRSPEEIEAVFGPGSWPVYQTGQFRYHWFLAYRYPFGIRQKLAVFRFYLKKSLEICRERRPDCIMVYSHQTTGLLACVLKLLTGIKLIVEIVTSPQHVYLTDRPQVTFIDRIKHFYSDCALHISMLIADRAHFLCAGQLKGYSLLKNVRNSAFADYVPVSIIPRHEEQVGEAPFVLFVGAPWYLKGVDLLITAFRNLEAEFPEVRLKLLGFFPDRAPLEAMIGASSRIDIVTHMPNPEAVRLISRASIFVLPSRCEGMPRVIIEAMGAGVPVIASDIGGIPQLVRDGDNGLLFAAGDGKALEDRLRKLLADPALRRRMGHCGFERTRQELTEQAYVSQFAAMVRDTVEENS